MDAANGRPICIIPTSFTMTNPKSRRPVKSNEARLGVVFKYCIFQLFTHLNKSAANNILFLFTNVRSTHYMPGESGPALIKILDQIRENPPNVDIPYDENTTYCFDNESFRYLVASVPPNNIQFDPRYKSTYVDSWDRSVEECQRLFDYIIQLPAHKVMDTLSLNNTKQMIQLLIKPLADISKNIADNVMQCERHIIEVNEYKGTIEELRKKLEIPSVEIISVPFGRPKTVCGHEECCERTTNNGVTIINYKTKCHSPCYLSFGDGDIIGNQGLKRCKAFSMYSGTDRDPGEPTGQWWERLVIAPIEKVAEVFTESDMCRECGHSYSKHLHLLNDTQTKVTKVRDQEVDKAIESTQSAAEAKELQIQRLDQRIVEMKTENETIVKSMSMFACFLANNSLTPINDAFKHYVEHLIANEQLVTTGAHSRTAIARLEQVLQQYDEQKQLIQKVMDGSVTVAEGSAITPMEIDSRVDQLCSLKHKGPEIRTMLDQQKQAKVNHNADCNRVQYKPQVNKGNCCLTNMAEQFSDQDEVARMPLVKKKEITILLLSESGVGKSTFINAFVNYMSFESMDAANGRPICLIPVSFSITDPKTRSPVKVTLGNQNDNENTRDPTQSATKYPKCYTFETEKIALNIIDTPGIADTDGVERDNRNMQNILNFISNYREINAFCVLLKPNESRVGVVFKYCIFQLFTHLNKSAANNILFLFTNSRTTHYMPGESGPALIKILKQIRENPPNVDIPYTADTTYCFDSESFRYLVASVPPNDIQFDPKYKSSYVDSWDRSVEECQRLFDYIIQLTPHKVMDTLSVNNTKQIIQLLIKPLADISKNIADNVNQCEKHRTEVIECMGTIDELRTKLDIPSVEIISVPLDRPETVCSAEQCIERVTNHGVTHINYKTKCHSPCYLSFGDGNIVGNDGLLRCNAFNEYSTSDCESYGFLDMLLLPYVALMGLFTEQTECHECGHSYDQHMHMVNETQTKVTMVHDQDVDSRIESTRSVAETKELHIKGLDQRIAEMEAEN
ncbi:unnamed protein product, partial [Medioppia subpectinata]